MSESIGTFFYDFPKFFQTKLNNKPIRTVAANSYQSKNVSTSIIRWFFCSLFTNFDIFNHIWACFGPAQGGVKEVPK